MLKPHSDEKVQPFWKSLEADEAPHPFAFKYDPTDSMKKKGKVEDEGDEEEGEGGRGTGIISTAMIDAAADTAVTKSHNAMKAMLEEYHLKSIEPMLADWHKKLVEDVAEKVARVLLDKAGVDNTYSCVGDVNATLDTVDHLADTQNTVPSMPLEPARADMTVVSTPAKTTVFAVEESTKIPAGALDSPGNPTFSLGVNFDSSQPEDLVQLSQNSTILAAAAVAPHPATSRPAGQAATTGQTSTAVGGNGTNSSSNGRRNNTNNSDNSNVSNTSSTSGSTNGISSHGSTTINTACTTDRTTNSSTDRTNN